LNDGRSAERGGRASECWRALETKNSCLYCARGGEKEEATAWWCAVCGATVLCGRRKFPLSGKVMPHIGAKVTSSTAPEQHIENPRMVMLSKAMDAVGTFVSMTGGDMVDMGDVKNLSAEPSVAKRVACGMDAGML